MKRKEFLGGLLLLGGIPLIPKIGLDRGIKAQKAYGCGFRVEGELFRRFKNGNTDILDRWFHSLIERLRCRTRVGGVEREFDIKRVTGLDIKNPEILIYGILKNRDEAITIQAGENRSRGL